MSDYQDHLVNVQDSVVWVFTNWKVENAGTELASEVRLALTTSQAERLAYMEVNLEDNDEFDLVLLPVSDISQQDTVTLYTLTLPKALKPGDSLTFWSHVYLIHQLKPFPEEISQSDVQLVNYDDSAYILAPYPIKTQRSVFWLRGSRLESFTKVVPTEKSILGVYYGPYENAHSLKSKPVTLHFEINQSLPVVEELVREIEVSHSGNVYVTENYKLANKGARVKSDYSRFKWTAWSGKSGMSETFDSSEVRLPANAHPVYYRDEIGDISTSHLRRAEGRLEDWGARWLTLELRYPLNGGCKSAFTLGYSVPLQDLVFKASDGSRYLNISFGSPFVGIVVDKLILKVVLPEGSEYMSMSVPFTIKQGEEKRYSYLNIVGRKVVVIEYRNSINMGLTWGSTQFVQVYYRFYSLGIVLKPLMLVFAFLALFAACIAYSDCDLLKRVSAFLPWIQRKEMVEKLQQEQTGLKDVEGPF